MIEIKGKFNTAKVLVTDYSSIEESCYTQILNLVNQEFCKGSNIVVMPDTHAGAGCVIGFTQTIKDYVVPNLVGVDIGCGMLVAKIEKAIGEKFFDSKEKLRSLDSVIRKSIPLGVNIRTKPHPEALRTKLENIIAPIDVDRAYLSVGTLGGGNHFIELDVDSNGDYYIVIHTGSRHLGVEVCSYYQNLAIKECMSNHIQRKTLIEELKKRGEQHLIEQELAKLPKNNVPKELAYLTGDSKERYLHDMKIVQDYAVHNRESILSQILLGLGIQETSKFTTIHNYIDTENNILRKGAISLCKDEIAIIPINMAYGSLIVKGKGSEEFNYSGPHGAGRILSRAKAKETLSLKEFQESMSSVFSTSVSLSTIDESPKAYKPVEEILTNIQDLCDIVDTIKPLYNLKAGD